MHRGQRERSLLLRLPVQRHAASSHQGAAVCRLGWPKVLRCSLPAMARKSISFSVCGSAVQELDLGMFPSLLMHL